MIVVQHALTVCAAGTEGGTEFECQFRRFHGTLIVVDSKLLERQVVTSWRVA